MKLTKNIYVMNHTTSCPHLAKKIYDELKSIDCYAIDAPFLGDIESNGSKLTVLAGGDEEAYRLCEPLLQEYSYSQEYMGGPGTGQQAKIADQIIAAHSMVGVCQSLIFSHGAGLDLHQLMRILKNGSAPQLLERESDSILSQGFKVEYFVKDLSNIIGWCDKMNLQSPGIEEAKKLLDHLVNEQALGKKGSQVLTAALEKMNNKIPVAQENQGPPELEEQKNEELKHMESTVSSGSGATTVKRVETYSTTMTRMSSKDSQTTQIVKLPTFTSTEFNKSLTKND